MPQNRDEALAAARRRQQGVHNSLAAGAPDGDPAKRQWTMEHILGRPLLRHVAYADWRFHRNRSAKDTLDSLAAAARQLEADDDGGDAA
jgi:hypothetical protein